MKQRPNIIWILGDQHRAQALSCMGDPNVRTPHIDRLAGSSPTTAVAGSPLCTPFRGSLLTSRYPHQCVPGHDCAMPGGMPTVAAAFRREGYQSAWFGKWHVDGEDNRERGTRGTFQQVRPERRGGFDMWLGYENNNDPFDCWVHGHDETGTEIGHESLPGYETDAFTDLFIDYLRRRGHEQNEDQKYQPFFAALSVQPPHSPYIAPEKYMVRHRPEDIQLRPNVPPVTRVQEEARKNLAGYYAMIENLDDNVGRITEALRAAGLFENTIVMFFSDHGDMHGSQGRGYKCLPFEESIRIPFFVARGDLSCSAGENRPRNLMINHVDIASTTLGLCGLEVPDWMAGSDFSSCFIPGRPEPASKPDSAFLQLVDPGFSHGIAIDRERPWRGIVTDDGWKYAVLEGQPWLMYNLNEDPYETANLALDGRFWSERDRLQEQLAAWISKTGDSFHLPDIEHNNRYVSSMTEKQ